MRWRKLVDEDDVENWPDYLLAQTLICGPWLKFHRRPRVESRGRAAAAGWGQVVRQYFGEMKGPTNEDGNVNGWEDVGGLI